MAAGKTPSLGPVALDDLVALSDEMAALVRAGVPLEHGLAQVLRDLARRPGKIAAELARRMQAGESLSHILASSPETFPPSYCAVVEAGLRSGRLSAALEGLASSAHRTAELRRMTRLAMLYPVFVALLAYALLVGSLIWFQPRLTSMYESMESPPSTINLFLSDLGQTAPNWGPWIPAVALAALAFWWFRSRRATASQSKWLRFTPAGRLVYYSRVASFTDLLALLIDSGTPLGEAAVLAADAGGDRRLQQSVRQFADEVGRGAHAAKPNGAGSSQHISGLPPLVAWQLVSGVNQPALADSLRSTAHAYRRRAQQIDDRLRFYLPLGLTIAIGGTAVAIYAVSMLGPWYGMLTHIAGGHR